MIFAIAKFITSLTGWDVSKVQRYVFWSLAGVIVILCVAVGLWVKSCVAKHRLKVTQQQVEKITKANEIERKAELQKVIDENTDVVKTVDNRTELTNANVWDRNHAADQRVADADKAIVAAHQQGRDVTQEELECLLVPDHCQ